MDQKLHRRFHLGAFEVEPLAGRIVGPGGTQHLQPKVMDVLVYLAQHPGELVERNTLLDHVWRRVTSEEVLTRCISELRRALGDDRGRPSYIETVPKRGYRLVEPVVLPPDDAEGSGIAVQEASPPAAVALGPPPLAAALASVAVLPFDIHSSDASHAFLGDAFAAELHSTLARVDRLRVASRRSSFVLKEAAVDMLEIGQKLGVDYVISGSVQCSGQRLRVVAELDDAVNATQVWARSYDRSNEDLLSIEKEIAEEIVGSFTTQQLRAEIRSARHKSTSSLDAWGLVQKARSFLLDYTAPGLAGAVELLQRAIELDRDYAAAHATLSSVLAERLVMGLATDPAHEEAAALEAAKKALALAPLDPFVLKMSSFIWTYCGDHRRAIGCLRKAVAQAPFDFGAWGYMGWPLTASGDAANLAELRRILDRLLGMEPHHPGIAFWLYHQSVADVCEGRYESAAESAKAALELRPSVALVWMHYANVLGHRKDKSGARRALEQCSQVNAAMTPEYFGSLIERMSASKNVNEQRLGGLRKIGALRR